MTELRWTPLRHKMLAEVDRNDGYLAVLARHPCYVTFAHSCRTLAAAEKRGLGQLLGALLVRDTTVFGPNARLSLSPTGLRVLSEWNSLYGEV